MFIHCTEKKHSYTVSLFAWIEIQSNPGFRLLICHTLLGFCSSRIWKENTSPPCLLRFTGCLGVVIPWKSWLLFNMLVSNISPLTESEEKTTDFYTCSFKRFPKQHSYTYSFIQNQCMLFLRFWLWIFISFFFSFCLF